ncbi:SubName: Full=Uncharacterized protein {ECO:0000313/EMBL:CCA73810.1} [Serendipita indica DSM 11827]|nr:SubName: Full=Uncharacterized protein {ECO:0000313/EMBL:CCA73810.1} [Serendipita indica DSM 11827]
MLLSEVMERYKFDHPPNEDGTTKETLPCDIFSMTIGSGHGGLVAILLGKLRMPVDAALEAYCSLLVALPTSPAQSDEERSQNATRLEEELRRILNFEGITPDDMMQTNTRKTESHRVVVCTGQTTNMSNPYYIRSYPSRGVQTAPCTILQAAMACMADPTLYPPVTFGKFHRRVTLIEAPARFANPTKLLLREAEIIYTENGGVRLILSLGCGDPELLTVEEYHGGPGRLQYGVESEQVHQDLLSRLKDTRIYYRLHPRGQFGLSEDPADIQARVGGFLQDVDISSSVDAVVRTIDEGWTQHAIALGDINSVRILDMGLPPRPSVVPNFLGREDVLAKLRSHHLGGHFAPEQLPRISVLAGIGGSGKTQCALKFALDVPNAMVYFVDARSEEALQQGLQNIVYSMKSGLSQRWSSSILTSLEAWMVILDNADDPSLKVLEYFPRYGNGNIIITTRNSAYANLTCNFQALEALESDNKESALAIINALGRLPLAIAHAAGYIRLHQCLRTYLDIYNESRRQLLRTKTMAMFEYYELSVASTIQMSLDKLPVPTQSLLRLLAEFHNTDIPFDVFKIAAKRRFSAPDLQVDIPVGDNVQRDSDALLNILCGDGKWSEAHFNELIEPCLNYSLLRVTSSGETRVFSMHILVQSWIQSIHETTEQHRLFVRLLSSSISRQSWAQIHLHRLIAPHIIQRVLIDQVAWADKWALAFAMDEVGNSTWSQKQLKEVLVHAETTFGDESPITLAIMTDLGTSYDRSGPYRIQTALTLHQRVLAARLKLRGEKDIETLSAMSNVASSLVDMWRNNEAESLYLKIIELLTATVGPDHPDVLRAESRLATILFRTGKRQLGYYRKVSMLERLDGKDTVTQMEQLRGMENIGTSLHILGRYPDALELFRQLSSVINRLLGPYHSTSIRIKLSTAGTLCRLGRFGEATEHLEHAFKRLHPSSDGDESSELAIRPEDRRNTPEGLSAQRLMCFVLFCAGNHAEAEERYAATVEAHLKTLGPDHPHTQWVQKPLAEWEDPTFIEYAIRKPGSVAEDAS